MGQEHLIDLAAEAVEMQQRAASLVIAALTANEAQGWVGTDDLARAERVVVKVFELELTIRECWDRLNNETALD